MICSSLFDSSSAVLLSAALRTYRLRRRRAGRSARHTAFIFDTRSTVCTNGNASRVQSSPAIGALHTFRRRERGGAASLSRSTGGFAAARVAPPDSPGRTGSAARCSPASINSERVSVEGSRLRLVRKPVPAEEETCRRSWPGAPRCKVSRRLLVAQSGRRTAPVAADLGCGLWSIASSGKNRQAGSGS